jgi:hypothetical protein
VDENLPTAYETDRTAHSIQAQLNGLVDDGNLDGLYSNGISSRLAKIIDEYTPL